MEDSILGARLDLGELNRLAAGRRWRDDDGWNGRESMWGEIRDPFGTLI